MTNPLDTLHRQHSEHPTEDTKVLQSSCDGVSRWVGLEMLDHPYLNKLRDDSAKIEALRSIIEEFDNSPQALHTMSDYVLHHNRIRKLVFAK